MRRSLRGWTLRTKLVASIVALYLAVTIITGTVTVLASRNSQLDQIDRSLVAAAESITGQGDSAPGATPPPGVGLGQFTCTLGTDGTIVATVNRRTQSTESSCVLVATDGRRSTVSQAEVNDLVQGGLRTAPKTATVTGQEFRVVSATHVDDLWSAADQEVRPRRVVEIRGLPTSAVQDSVWRLVRTVLSVSLLGLAVVGLAAGWLVRRNLAPLRRVAGTADRVARLPLATGEVGTQERVNETDSHTEVGQVGSALNELLDHVDHSLAARHRSEMQVRQFVADASHELRTPLASIKGYAELSRREPDPVPDSVRHALSRIESESERMTALVEDLLLLARLDSGRPLAQEPVDLTLAAIETVSDARAAGPGHQWALDLPDEPCEIIGDEARLHQVLINLLANARRHTPAGTAVTTGVRRTPDGVEIAVVDTGPGIPEDLQQHIFERFARGDEARQRRGGSTGLGLAIVHAVVTAHRGRITVESQPGRTVFRVWLPT